MAKSIIITDLAPNGEARIEVKGERGSGCKAATESLSRALGATIGGGDTDDMFLPPQEETITITH